jgi:fumarate hydratase class II
MLSEDLERIEHALKQAALKLGFVKEEQFDQVVDPMKMVAPYVAIPG